MSEKFTPGPWHRDAFNLSSVLHQTSRDYEVVARAQGDNWDANARLIAAAPELYEALKEAMRLVDVDIIRVRPSEKTDLMNWLTQCGAALAKARGETC